MSPRSGSGTAHGKVILLGEHAVVYGAPALAAGLDRGARADVVLGGPDRKLRLGGATVDADPNAEGLARAWAALLDEGSPVDGAVASASSELPAGGGLGSSAALGVALGRAVEAAVSGVPARQDGSLEPGAEARALARAAAWERVFHGNPSGIDAAAAANGGCFRFTRADGARPVVPAADLWLCVGSSGAGASTKAMVDSVARLRARRPDVVDRGVEAIRSLVDNAALALEAGDLVALGRLFDLNQMILAGWMLSNEAIERLCGIARGAGALGAKLTGAGGGGSVIALAPSSRVGHEAVDDATARAAADAILARWKDAGFDGFVARIEAPARAIVVQAMPRSDA